MNLEHLKSAEVIDDPEQIVNILGKDRGASLRDDGTVHIKGKGHLGFKAAPALPPPDELKRLAESRGIVWEDSMKDRVVPYWLSDERPDGHGDITLQNWDFTDYERNPVMAFNHRWDGFSVGVGIQEQVLTRTENDYTGRALHFLGLFAQYDFADELLRLVKSRFFRGVSPGFSATRVIDVKDPDERESLGLGRYGYVLDQNVLLEASPTLLGANPGAVSLLTAAKSSHGLQGKDIELLRELARQNSETEEEFLKSDRAYVAAAKVVFPSHDFNKARFDEPIVIEERETKAMIMKEVEEETEPNTDERLSRIESAFNELASYVSTTLTDIRDMLETLVEPEPGYEEEVEGEEDVDPEEKSLDATLQRLEKMLSLQ